MEGSLLKKDEPKIEELDEIPINPEQPERVVNIEWRLDPKVRSQSIEFLEINKDYFAWSYTDMSGIDPEVINYKLNMDSNHKPVCQKWRKFRVDRNQIVNEDVRWLLEAGFICEI